VRIAEGSDARRPPGSAVPGGSRERGSSPWLGGTSARSEAFEAWQAVEQRAAAYWQWPGTALAPVTPAGAYLDWALHLLGSPAKTGELAQLTVEQWIRGWRALLLQSAALNPSPQDKRFDDPAWADPPYRTVAGLFLLQQEWWQRATTGVPGVSRHHEQMVSFAARQWLDLVAPSNFVSTNPVVQQRTLQEGGMNLVRGLGHAVEDAWRQAADRPPAGAEAFAAGKNVAITPGRVVLRNRLMELIQYAPTTPTVHAEPVLLVPAWIMKYYVLDLSPSNSLVKHLVDQGFTVFAISWKNPDAGDRDLGMDDYCELGIRAALNAISAIVPDTQVHATGYCLGGTLLATVAAALGQERESPLRSLSLLAAQTDFTEPGELGLFIDESQVAFLESGMARRGYLDKRQMAGTFQMLRSNDLVWSYRLHSHLLGERRPMTDLMAWNADGTRLPYRMHIEYLRGMFLRNALARGEWKVAGQPVNLADIRVPIFNVGVVQDHVAPWRSVFKLNALTDAEQTFVLTAGGHNVGIVNPPGRKLSSYRLRERHASDRLMTPDQWLEATSPLEGSWWTAWVHWLRRRSSRRTAPPALGAPQAGLQPLEPAPGRYVHQR
jgi:polyhydroxyalkanoate synthase